MQVLLVVCHNPPAVVPSYKHLPSAKCLYCIGLLDEMGPVSWFGLSGWGFVDVSASTAADKRLGVVAIADADFTQMWGVVGFEPQYLRIWFA